MLNLILLNVYFSAPGVHGNLRFALGIMAEVTLEPTQSTVPKLKPKDSHS